MDKRSDTTSNKTRNIIRTTPVTRNTTINKIAIGFSPEPWSKAQRLTINGLSVHARPLDIFLGVLCANVFGRFVDQWVERFFCN